MVTVGKVDGVSYFLPDEPRDAHLLMSLPKMILVYQESSRKTVSYGRKRNHGKDTQN